MKKIANHSLIEAIFHCASCQWYRASDVPCCEHYDRPLHEVASMNCNYYEPDELCDILQS